MATKITGTGPAPRGYVALIIQTPFDPRGPMADPKAFTRRDFLLSAGMAIAAVPALAYVRRLSAGPVSRHTPGNVTIVEFTDAGVKRGAVTVAKVVKTDEEWRTQLKSDLAFSVARKGGTERPFTGAYWNEHGKGIFRCACCDTALFSSAAKFDSGTGWPSYWEPIAEENVKHGAPSGGYTNSEVTCRRCDAHLGDLFDDGPKPTGLRYCIDSISLKFIKSA
jgi:peptide-methionine (R)-S-oxide reductase